MEERDKVQVEAKSLLKERNSENNNKWGTKSLLKERKAELDHSKTKAKGEEDPKKGNKFISRQLFFPNNSLALEPCT